MKRSLHLLGSLLLSTSLLASTPSRGHGEGDHRANLSVQCSRTSSLVRINLTAEKRIGKLVLEVRDQQGRTLYREEGNALTGELVRNIDKGVFPRGTHQLTVIARDIEVSQPFTVE